VGFEVDIEVQTSLQTTRILNPPFQSQGLI
jgi:hypothetical protein